MPLTKRIKLFDKYVTLMKRECCAVIFYLIRKHVKINHINFNIFNFYDMSIVKIFKKTNAILPAMGASVCKFVATNHSEYLLESYASWQHFSQSPPLHN